MFVDESKKQDYLLVAAAIVPGDLSRARTTVRGLQKPGQRRLHVVNDLPGRGGVPHEHRAARSVPGTARRGHRRGRLRPADAREVLAIPDAIAWAWAHGGDARRRAEPLVTGVVRL
ncbi:hypothetical protein [Luteimicrobium subarcticum]|uniref:hypothetical protein n=1 Tax=Luteimicrobium subarcticum TaxID=620910 RepID=UPI000C23B32E|nr:hypothetical protein [Luteimicrobium subarcticum]